MRTLLILLFGKTKALFGKDTARKKTAFLHTFFVENERETGKLITGGIFLCEVEGHMQKFSSFGRGKKIGLKSHLVRGFCRQPFNNGVNLQTYKLFTKIVWNTMIFQSEVMELWTGLDFRGLGLEIYILEDFSIHELAHKSLF